MVFRKAACISKSNKRSGLIWFGTWVEMQGAVRAVVFKVGSRCRVR